MTKNTLKTFTKDDIQESLARLKVQVITKYKERFKEAGSELEAWKIEREESRNVMHDIGLENKMSILEAERHSLDWCIRTLKQQK